MILGLGGPYQSHYSQRQSKYLLSLITAVTTVEVMKGLISHCTDIQQPGIQPWYLARNRISCQRQILNLTGYTKYLARYLAEKK